MSERRIYVSAGIFIGAGMILIVLGFGGWLMTSFLLDQLTPLLENADPNFVLTYIGRIEIADVALMGAGILSSVVGAVMLIRKKGVRV